MCTPLGRNIRSVPPVRVSPLSAVHKPYVNTSGRLDEGGMEHPGQHESQGAFGEVTAEGSAHPGESAAVVGAIQMKRAKGSATCNKKVSTLKRYKNLLRFDRLAPAHLRRGKHPPGCMVCARSELPDGMMRWLVVKCLCKSQMEWLLQPAPS
jgi:hypothetical protein